jgi:hypothetical protein
MAVRSYSRGEKNVIFDSDDAGLGLNSTGDELWLTPYIHGDQLPEKLSWEIIMSGTFTAGAVDLEGTLGQEHSIVASAAVLSVKAASGGPNWFQIDTIPLTTGGSTLRFVTDKKVRAVRIRVSTAVTGTTPRAIVAVAA